MGSRSNTTFPTTSESTSKRKIGIMHFFDPHIGHGKWLRWVAPVLDRIFGIKKLDNFYEEADITDLAPHPYCEKAITTLNINVLGKKELAEIIPSTGPVVVVANHPCGGIEGIILAHLLTQIRPDTKVLANTVLSIFAEIKSFFIFTNPLKANDPMNMQSIRSCSRHLKNGGVLLVFPAGRVSFFQKETSKIADSVWNRLPGRLAVDSNAATLPLYIEAQNSKLFYFLSRIHGKFRMFMLAHEFIKQRGKTISFKPGVLVPAAELKKEKSPKKATAKMRALTYAKRSLDQGHLVNKQDKVMQKLAVAISSDLLHTEIQSLPEEQELVSQGAYQVYYGYENQLPKTVREISRLRELTFRLLEEGSGQPLDTDPYDKTYTHLFAYNSETKKIVGAYRMGQTDLLLENDGLSGLYLSQMFNFGPSFLNQTKPCLEMGRSFIIPEYQKKLHALSLLWKGIGAFVKKHPRYETLYGTVSLSRLLYSSQSVSAISKGLDMASGDLEPKEPFKLKIDPELALYISKYKPSFSELADLVNNLEDRERHIPVLMKQYYRLGAKFYTVGVDENFNDTPGLLLSVNLRDTPPKILKKYMGEGHKF